MHVGPKLACILRVGHFEFFRKGRGDFKITVKGFLERTPHHLDIQAGVIGRGGGRIWSPRGFPSRPVGLDSLWGMFIEGRENIYPPPISFTPFMLKLTFFKPFPIAS